MEFKVNANAYVKVHLTIKGIEILQERHNLLQDQILERTGSDIGDFELRVDDEGYYKAPLWSLMEVFGEHVTIGTVPPFGIDLIITDGVPVSEEGEKV